jgi:hypothetical protein
VFRREFKHTPKGLLAWAVNRFGTHLYGWDLRRALAPIESRHEILIDPGGTPTDPSATSPSPTSEW